MVDNVEPVQSNGTGSTENCAVVAMDVKVDAKLDTETKKESNQAAPPAQNGTSSSDGAATQHNNGTAEEVTSMDDCEMRFLIPGFVAGAVIGDHGAKIRELQERHSVRLYIPHSRMPDAVLVVIGPQAHIFNALADVIGIMKEDRRFAPEGVMELKLLVHRDMVGAIIGKGGSNVKVWVRECGVTEIQAFNECCPASTESVVRIRGQAVQNMLNCARRILRTCIHFVLRNETVLYHPQNYDAMRSPSYGGFTPLNRYGAHPLGLDGSAKASWSNHHTGATQSDQHGPMSTYRMITVPDDLVGHLVGKNGQMLAGLAGESGADIKIGELSPSAPSSFYQSLSQSGPPPPHHHHMLERVVTLCGSHKQIQAAEFLIQKLVSGSQATAGRGMMAPPVHSSGDGSGTGIFKGRHPMHPPPMVPSVGPSANTAPSSYITPQAPFHGARSLGQSNGGSAVGKFRGRGGGHAHAGW